MKISAGGGVAEALPPPSHARFYVVVRLSSFTVRRPSFRRRLPVKGNAPTRVPFTHKDPFGLPAWGLVVFIPSNCISIVFNAFAAV